MKRWYGSRWGRHRTAAQAGRSRDSKPSRSSASSAATPASPDRRMRMNASRVRADHPIGSGTGVTSIESSTRASGRSPCSAAAARATERIVGAVEGHGSLGRHRGARGGTGQHVLGDPADGPGVLEHRRASGRPRRSTGARRRTPSRGRSAVAARAGAGPCAWPSRTAGRFGPASGTPRRRRASSRSAVRSRASPATPVDPPDGVHVAQPARTVLQIRFEQMGGRRRSARHGGRRRVATRRRTRGCPRRRGRGHGRPPRRRGRCHPRSAAGRASTVSASRRSRAICSHSRGVRTAWPTSNPASHNG